MALALFAVIGLAVIGLFLSTRAADRSSLVGAQAANLGAAEMRRLKGQGYAALAGYLSAPLPPYNVTSEGVDYHLTLTVGRLNSSPASPEYGLLDLALQLEWQQNRSLSVGDNPAARQSTVVLKVHSVASPDSLR